MEYYVLFLFRKCTIMKILNKLRQKAWYWDVLCFIWCTLLFLLFCILTVPDIKGQEIQVKPYHYTPGIIGLSAMPTSLVAVNLNKYNFTQQFGNVEPYMNNNKLSAYNKMMNDNNTILITGTLVTITGLVIQHFISEKISKKRKKRNYICNF